MSGLYIHIPFCASRCIYCGFYSTTAKGHLTQRYLRALQRELDLRSTYLSEDITTIYIGGGTPSTLSSDDFAFLGKMLQDARKTAEEFTVECNPDDITPTLVQSLVSIGVNRVSMGVQTFSDERLRFLHRRHTSADIRDAVDVLRRSSINNISIDLMFGFPKESIADWKWDIQQALALDVEHLSAYSLMYEEGTPLYNMLEKGDVSELNDDIAARMYEELIDALTAAGYEHYEISNFAKKGFRSQHNSNYWRQVPYMGLGAAAHSYDIHSRQWNISDLDKYIERIEQGEIPMERELLDDATRYNDLITTALRTREGIDTRCLDKEYKDYLLQNARRNIDNGLLTLDDHHLRLTRKGLFVSDAIMSDLIKVP